MGLAIGPSALRDVVSPAMLRLEAEHLLGLAVGQQRLEFAELALDRHAGVEALQKLARRQVGGRVVIGRVEDLEAEAVLLDCKLGDLAEIARVDIAPGDALAETGIGEPVAETAHIHAAR